MMKRAFEKVMAELVLFFFSAGFIFLSLMLSGFVFIKTVLD